MTSESDSCIKWSCQRVPNKCWLITIVVRRGVSQSKREMMERLKVGHPRTHQAVSGVWAKHCVTFSLFHNWPLIIRQQNLCHGIILCQPHAHDGLKVDHPRTKLYPGYYSESGWDEWSNKSTNVLEWLWILVMESKLVIGGVEGMLELLLDHTPTHPPTHPFISLNDKKSETNIFKELKLCLINTNTQK